MSNFMPLRQLITDLINTLWLAILKLTGGRAFSASVCARRGQGAFACVRVIEERATEVVSMRIHPGDVLL